MATLAFSLAGQVVGGALGGPVGVMLGRAVGALAGSAVDGMLFGQSATPQRQGADVHLQGSVEGGAVPRLYGWRRLTGNIIWATELERVTTQSRGAKGTRTQSEDEIFASFAVALCEGEVQRLGRIWADGRLLETEGLTIRFHRGTQVQMPDSFIEARQGQGGRRPIAAFVISCSSACRWPSSAIAFPISRWKCAGWWANWNQRSPR